MPVRTRGLWYPHGSARRPRFVGQSISQQVDQIIGVFFKRSGGVGFGRPPCFLLTRQPRFERRHSVVVAW